MPVAPELRHHLRLSLAVHYAPRDSQARSLSLRSLRIGQASDLGNIDVVVRAGVTC
jgi:hypothetical protein